MDPLSAPPVLGGREAPAGRWPSTAALLDADGLQCSGVLVDPVTVLTAAHCGTPERVVLGGVAIADGEVRGVVSRTEVEGRDLAFLTLDVPALSPPAELGLGCGAAGLVDGAMATVVGHGAVDTGAGTFPERAVEVDLPVLQADCADPDRDCRGGEILAGGEGLDSCTGDSGGPLYTWVEGRPYLSGITSRAALPQETPCGDGGIYVRIDALDLPAPDCANGNRAPAPFVLGPLAALQRGSGELQVHAGDPDQGQSFTWWVESSDLDGLSVQDGMLHLEAGDPAEGRAVVGVSDGALEGRVEVELRVEAEPAPHREPEPLTGCGVGSPALGAGLLALIMLRGRLRL